MKRNKMLIFQCLLFLFVIGVVYFSLIDSDKSSFEESTSQMEAALNKAVTQCYSIEGAYPESLEYLLDNYQVYVDEDKYIVHYVYEASNIRPDILIMRKDGSYEK